MEENENKYYEFIRANDHAQGQKQVHSCNISPREDERSLPLIQLNNNNLPSPRNAVVY